MMNIDDLIDEDYKFSDDLFYDDFAFLNYTFDIPPIVFDDFVDFVSGQINIFSTETLDFLDLN